MTSIYHFKKAMQFSFPSDFLLRGCQLETGPCWLCFDFGCLRNFEILGVQRSYFFAQMSANR